MSKNNSAAEQRRINSLKSFHILDTLPEREFDDLTLLASQICETPIATISLIDEDRQWFKSRVGLSVTETPRDVSFCDLTIESDELFVVPDAREDSRFADNPLVTKDPNLRFYAGAPLVASDGNRLGALCVLDRRARELTDEQKRALSALSRSVISLLEARRETIDLKNALTEPAVASELKESRADENANELFLDTTETEKASFFNRHVKHYLIATLIVIVTTLVKILLDSITNLESPFLLFACAILLAAWRGGLGAGIYTTLAASLVIDFYFLEPRGVLLVHGPAQNILLLIFIAQGVFITLLCASRIRGENLLRYARNQLEIRVARRTGELAQANKILHQEIQERSILQKDLRQARDMALESARLKSDFLANMSHEIRTPMNGVIGVTGLLLDTKLDAEQKRFAEIIRNSGESLLTVINDILDFSKVEAGKLDLETLDFNLLNTIESTVELLSSRAQAQKNELVTLIYNDVPLHLRGDAGRIQQILTNLVGNAIKFTKQGDIFVRVKKIHEENSRVQLKFSITDTGEGISKEVQQRLFQPFTQSDASTTRRFGGTGLGLSISRKLVEMMNGEIGVESELGQGSTFWFTIALEKQKPLGTANQDAVKSFINHSALNGKHALVVDDNAINREVLTYQARTWNLKVQEATSGIEAIAAIDKANAAGQPFELVILDLQMPEMDGLETARRIVSKTRAANYSVKPAMIMLSSSGVKIDEKTMSETGIRKFLTKPYRQTDLLDGIYETLGLNRRGKLTSSEGDIHITAADYRPEPGIENLSETRGKQKRILLVEDNQVNQLVAQTLLKKFGYQTDVAGNGLEAIKALEMLPYDLVLMDCQMPEMDGYEATRAIRARDWTVAEIPIIALTAHAIEGEREKCLAAGMNDYLSKPIQRNALEEMLNRWISASRAETKSEDSADENGNSKNDSPVAEQIETSLDPAVDFAVLNDITDNDADMRREVVEMYLAQTITHLDQIERAITFKDAATLSNVAHKTVGGSAICGMKAIVEPLRKLERLGLDGKTEEAAPYLAQARQAFVSINEQCADILSK